MKNTVTSQTLPLLLKDSISQTFEFFLDEATQRWIGNLILSFADKPTTIFEICTTREKRKTWSLLEGCLKFALISCPEAEINFKIKNDDTVVTFIHKKSDQ